MYAVIFRATIKHLDEEYLRMAKRLRELAFSKYGCLDFVSASEGNQEIAISYWEDTEHIRRWREDPEHSLARLKGKSSWYSSYRVEVCEVGRRYDKSLDSVL